MFTGIITEEGVVGPDDVDRVLHKYDHLIPELRRLVDWEKWEE
jgi:hypothetical protein